MNKIILGKYIPVDSIIHKLDPRTKIIAMILMLIAVFINAGWIGYFLIAIFLFSICYIAKVKISSIYSALKPMFFMLAFLLLINILVVKSGNLLLDLGFLTIYDSAVFDTLFIAFRLMLMVTVSTILTSSTKPLDLTMGIEKLLKPFRVIGLPYHDIAMMISIALRFIPTIIEESYRIMNAQKSRGVDFEEGKLKEKIQAILSLIVPLFSVSLNMADDLANAMEARSYVPGAYRTRFRILKYGIKDILAFILCLILIVILIIIGNL